MHASCITGVGIAFAAALAPWLWLSWSTSPTGGPGKASRDLIPPGTPPAVAEVAVDGLILIRLALATPDLKPTEARQLSLDGNDHLLVRMRLGSSPGSLVIKRFGHNTSLPYAPMHASMQEVLGRLESYRHPSLDFQREAEALRLLNGTLARRKDFLSGWRTNLAPLFYGSSASSGTLVMQDLGGTGDTLCHLLGVVFKGGAGASSPAAGRKLPTPEAVSFAFGRIGEVLARVHSPELRGFHEGSFLRGITMSHDSELFSSSVSVVKSLLERAGVTIPSGFRAEVQEVARSLSNPGMWLSLTHGDVCADNVWLMSVGSDVEPMMIDYSSAGLRHCLADLAAVLLLFPTCWCVGDVPWPVMERVVSQYRHTRLVELEGREEHLELHAALLDDATFNAALMRMASFHLLVLLSEYWNDAQQNLRCGHVPCRAHIMTRLSVYLKLASQCGGGGQPTAGGIVSTIQKLQQGLQKAWPDARLPPFPTFGRLDRTRISQSAAREEERRLRAVSHDALPRPGGGGGGGGGAAAQPYRPVPTLQAEGTSALAALSQGAGLPAEPLVLVSSSLAGWPRSKKWTSLVDVAKSARADMRWTIKTTGGPPGPPGAAARFPLGCCRTVLLSSTELLRAGASLSDGGSLATFYASTVVSGEPAILEQMPPVSDLAVAAVANHSSIANVWAGSRGSIAPLHYDPFHNVVLQVSGRKRFILAPPAAAEHVYLHPRLHLRHRQAQLNLNDVDRLRFWQARGLQGQVFVATLEPGDCLYLPPFWLHQVEALETALSLSVFSGDVHGLRDDPAWEVPAPSGFGSWATEEVTSYVALYIRAMLEGLLPVEASSRVFEHVLETRYEAVLYADELSPRLEVLQPEENEAADPHVAQYALDTADECWIGCCGRGCKAAAAARARFCGAGEAFRRRQAAALGPIVGPRVLAIKAQVAARGLASGALRIMLEDFIEDVAAMAVGETQVYAFLKSCRW